MGKGKWRGFIERAEEIRSEVKQIFLDAEHWNSCVRKLDEERIDPDPRGELKQILDCLEKFIAGASRVPSAMALKDKPITGNQTLEN